MTFDYHSYYRRVQDLKRLQIPAPAIRWFERYERPSARHDIVLYLGCNILRTPDIAADVVSVFTALGFDFVAVAGVQFCCGVTWDRNGCVDDGRSVSSTTIERLASYQPRQIVHWCPSCDVHFADVITGRDARELPFEVTSVAGLLAPLARAGKIPWRRPIQGRAVIHGHVGRADHASGRRRAREDTEKIGEILRHLPGVDLIGAREAPEQLDYDCGPSVPSFERSRWREIRSALWSELVATGADLVVTKSHACQREWTDLATEQVRVRCYISLIADALDLPREYPTDPLALLKKNGTADGIVQLSRSRWATHDLTESEAREIVERYDWTDSPERPVP